MFDTPYDKMIAAEVSRLNKKQVAHMKRVGRGVSGGAMSGGAGLADLLQIPLQLMSLPLKMMGLGGAVPVGAGVLGGNIPPQELRFGMNPATFAPNPANYAKGHGVSGGFVSGGASSGGRKHGGALLMDYDGGAMSGGKGKSAKSKKAAKHNPWIAHVKKVAAEKGIKYNEALKIAKQSYK